MEMEQKCGENTLARVICGVTCALSLPLLDPAAARKKNTTRGLHTRGRILSTPLYPKGRFRCTGSHLVRTRKDTVRSQNKRCGVAPPTKNESAKLNDASANALSGCVALVCATCSGSDLCLATYDMYTLTGAVSRTCRTKFKTTTKTLAWAVKKREVLVRLVTHTHINNRLWPTSSP